MTHLTSLPLRPIKILLTGSGRVARGANEILEGADIKKISVNEYLSQDFDEAVYCWIDADEYVVHKTGQPFDFNDFFKNGQDYVSRFGRFAKVTDLFIAGHFWDPSSPVFFTSEEAAQEEFNIRVIADISCDIDGPIPSTIRPSIIESPVYDYNRHTGSEEAPYSDEQHISVMAVDNLPCELPVDASTGFGDTLLEKVLPLVIKGDQNGILERATLTTPDGKLMPLYNYMAAFVGDLHSTD